MGGCNITQVQDACYYINHADECSDAVATFNYLALMYCNEYDGLFIGGIVVMIIWLFFLLSGLGISADSFFCPSLQIIAEKMKMSHNVAGVTIVAIGNGAPDIFSVIAAVRQGRPQLVFGELYGAGMFVTSVVAGSVCLFHPFDVMRRPFLRDCGFYLGSAIFVFLVYYHEIATLGHTIGFIVIYVVYVISVVVGRIISVRLEKKPEEAPVSIEQITQEEEAAAIDFIRRRSMARVSIAWPLPRRDSDSTIDTTLTALDDIEISNTPSHSPNTEYRPSVSFATAVTQMEIQDKKETSQSKISEQINIRKDLRDFWRGLRPFSFEQWKEMPWYQKIYRLLQAPVYLVLSATTPIVDEELPRNGWCRLLQCFQLTVSPPWAIWVIGYQDYFIGDVLSLPLLAFIIGFILAILLYFFTARRIVPAWHWLFALFAFGASVLWIQLFANEVLAVLFTLGVVFNWSDAILGLTILAWANSIGDFIANTSMARHGTPRIGFSACYGSPLQNMLLGLGISFIIVQLESREGVPVAVYHLGMIMALFLFTSLVSALILIPISGFHADRKHGMYFIILYIIFLTIAILHESDIIWPQTN